MVIEVTALFTTGKKRTHGPGTGDAELPLAGFTSDERLALYQLSYGRMNARRDSNPRPPEGNRSNRHLHHGSCDTKKRERWGTGDSEVQTPLARIP